MKFSICVPNYNYARYIPETILSVLDQNVNVEVTVSDNCSTDDSVAQVKALQDSRVRVRQNTWNVGFAGNLDRACQGASGDRMILLSSDDLAGPGSLHLYARLAEALGERADKAVFASDQYVIDGTGRIIGAEGRDGRIWRNAVHVEALSEKLGCTVLHVPAKTLLRRALEHLRTPFAFATTCYPRALYQAVEGYGGGALMNPDKTFAWKLLSVAEDVYYVEAPLFSYRVHDTNQSAQQQQSGALKHLMDQYRATFDTATAVLEAAALTQKDLAKAFIEHDVALRGLKSIAAGERHLARRHLDFGRAAFPSLMLRSRRAWMLRAALILGPVGTWIARRRLQDALAAYRAGDVIKTSPSTSADD
jgi:hypothetical protein